MTELDDYVKIGNIYNSIILKQYIDNSKDEYDENIRDYIYYRIKYNIDSDIDPLFIPYIEEDYKIDGLYYSNSLMFISKSTINYYDDINDNNIIERIETKMLVMIFPYIEVNEEKNGYNSGFKLVYTFNNFNNFNDLSLSQELYLEIENGEIKLESNNILSIKYIDEYNENRPTELKINFGADEFFVVYQNNLLQWNETNRNDCFNNFNKKCIYKESNFNVDGSDYTEKLEDNDNFVENDEELDQYFINDDNKNDEFYTLINYLNQYLNTNQDTIFQSFIRIKGYNDIDFTYIYPVQECSPPEIIPDEPLYYQKIYSKDEKKEINNKVYIRFPFCSGFLLFGNEIKVPTKQEEGIGEETVINYEELKTLLENQYYVNLTDVLLKIINEEPINDSFFSIYIGNKSIRLNDTNETIEENYEKFKIKVENYINEEKNKNMLTELETIEDCYNNKENINNIYLSIFITIFYSFKFS